MKVQGECSRVGILTSFAVKRISHVTGSDATGVPDTLMLPNVAIPERFVDVASAIFEAFGVQGLGVGFGIGFRVWGSFSMVSGLGIRVWGLRFRV